MHLYMNIAVMSHTWAVQAKLLVGPPAQGLLLWIPGAILMGTRVLYALHTQQHTHALCIFASVPERNQASAADAP